MAPTKSTVEKTPSCEGPPRSLMVAELGWRGSRPSDSGSRDPGGKDKKREPGEQTGAPTSAPPPSDAGPALPGLLTRLMKVMGRCARRLPKTMNVAKGEEEKEVEEEVKNVEKVSEHFAVKDTHYRKPLDTEGHAPNAGDHALGASAPAWRDALAPASARAPSGSPGWEGAWESGGRFGNRFEVSSWCRWCKSAIPPTEVQS